ncbi:hypothetical protein ISS40_07125 [Candidatus Bathyarchaeota archaeon]|nr:hypothetical protein [Candidatus Bathyarchaeota archaeon]
MMNLSPYRSPRDDAPSTMAVNATSQSLTLLSPSRRHANPDSGGRIIAVAKKTF